MIRPARRPRHSIFERADMGITAPTPDKRASGPIFTNPRFRQGSAMQQTHDVFAPAILHAPARPMASPQNKKNSHKCPFI